MRRWLTEHLERERQKEQERTARELERHNETLRILSQASAPVVQPTLGSLLSDEKADWSLESSVTPFDPHPATDWNDDNDPTATLRETPSAKRLSQRPVKWTPKPRDRSRDHDPDPSTER